MNYVQINIKFAIITPMLFLLLASKVFSLSNPNLTIFVPSSDTSERICYLGLDFELSRFLIYLGKMACFINDHPIKQDCFRSLDIYDKANLVAGVKRFDTKNSGELEPRNAFVASKSIVMADFTFADSNFFKICLQALNLESSEIETLIYNCTIHQSSDDIFYKINFEGRTNVKCDEDVLYLRYDSFNINENFSIKDFFKREVLDTPGELKTPEVLEKTDILKKEVCYTPQNDKSDNTSGVLIYIICALLILLVGIFAYKQFTKEN